MVSFDSGATSLIMDASCPEAAWGFSAKGCMGMYCARIRKARCLISQ
jgi:hypothetical protein